MNETKQRRINNNLAGVIGFLSLAILVTGCADLQMPVASRGSSNVSDPPDYLKPETEFVEANFDELASEFKDEYVNQYVTFEGIYVSHKQGYTFFAPDLRPTVYNDLMEAQIGGGTAFRYLPVIWSVDDRELGRPFLSAGSQSPIRIYGFVLPPNTRAKLKSRQDKFMRGFSGPTVLLIKAEPINTNQ